MNNSDLSFLTDCSNEQLRLLADVLVFDPKDHKKRYTERLSARASYAVYYPHDMKKLLPEIVDEYQRFGGNTIANIIRGHGVPYREILKDVCKTVGIAKSDTDTVEIMEAALLKTVADKMLEQIAKQNASGEQSVEEMKKYVEEFTHYPDQMTELILMSFSSWLTICEWASCYGPVRSYCMGDYCCLDGFGFCFAGLSGYYSFDDFNSLFKAYSQ